jgi:hypothetical protein
MAVHKTRAWLISAHRHADEHAQNQRPNMAIATPLGPPGAQTAEKQHAGLLKLDAQPSAARTRLPEGAA